MAMQRKIPEYILAICPEGETLGKVSALKQQLYNVIGWFGSYRSLAHITIEAFDAEYNDLQLRKELIQSFVRYQQNQILTFNSIAWFEQSRTVFVAPDVTSQSWLKSFARSYYLHLYKKENQNLFMPHLTIGRSIESSHFDKAKQVFSETNVTLTFLCDNIALRKFNESNKQYDIIERFHFG